MTRLIFFFNEFTIFNKLFYNSFLSFYLTTFFYKFNIFHQFFAIILSWDNIYQNFFFPTDYQLFFQQYNFTTNSQHLKFIPNLLSNFFIINTNFFNISFSFQIENIFILFCINNLFWLEIVFFFFIIFFIFLKIYQTYFSFLYSFQINFNIFYESFLFFCLNIFNKKFESYEETFCIIILWPWCIFLVITHLINIDNNEIFFIFIEWGLPILFGYFIIFEHIWLFSTHFFIYLNGSKGRKTFFLTLFEDLLTSIILIARISLQLIRGLICGLYHDFFREISEWLINTWHSSIFLFNGFIPFSNNFIKWDITFFFVDCYLIGFCLLFIYFILFLQLIFLLIAVWLFTRCWFISSKRFINV